MPLWELADDPDDPNEMAKARSAVSGLERRGLVGVWRGQDPSRRTETNRVQYVGSPPVLAVAPAVPAVWFGMWVELSRECAEDHADWRASVRDIPDDEWYDEGAPT